MKSLSYALVATLFAALVLIACRKESSEEPVPPSSTPTLITLQAEYYPLEVALFEISGASPLEGIYDASFNGQPIQIAVTGNLVSFMIPLVNTGIHTLTTTLGPAGTFSVSCIVREPISPLPAEQYLIQLEASMVQASTDLRILLDSLGPLPEVSQIESNSERLVAFVDSVQEVIAGATEEDKLQFAQIIAANNHWVTSFEDDVNELLLAVNQTNRSVINRETVWHVAAGEFVRVSALALIRAAAIGAAFTISLATSIEGVGLIGLVGVAILASDLVDDANAVVASAMRLLNIGIIAHQQLEGDVEEFQSGQDALIVLEATYRTIYQGDETTPTSNFVQRFVTGYGDFRNRISNFFALFPSSIRPNFNLPALSESYENMVRRIHSDWISVGTTTSDPAVTVQKIANGDGSTSLRFTNMSDEPKSVTYTVQYSHPDLASLSTTFSAMVSVEGTTSTVTDIDGNIYYTVQIGTQVWMKENLRTTRYRSGTPISNVEMASMWTNLNTAAYCDYDNNPDNSVTYGRLYNWLAATSPIKICPLGWHLPSDLEWQQLESTLGMPLAELNLTAAPRGEAQNIAGQLRSTFLWNQYDIVATNSSGFSALPCGTRNWGSGGFSGRGSNTMWWAGPTAASPDPWSRWLIGSQASLSRQVLSPNWGVCIRCVQD